MQKVYIASAKRTAIGKNQGSLKDISCGKMGAEVVKSILNETGVPVNKIDEVIVGNVLSANQGQGVARQVSVYAGIPETVCAYAVNMVCGSSMKAVMNGFISIQSGNADLIIAGGVENMSSAPYMIPAKIRNGNKMGNFEVIDHMLLDSLTDAFSGQHMGITAENIAAKYHITRQEQDGYSYQSQKKAKAAIETYKFKNEIVPIEVKERRETKIFAQDEFPNFNSTIDSLSKLKPAFIEDGTVTAGNASGINDGASMILIASERACKEYDLKPLCEIVASAQGGVDPDYMGLGPVVAVENLLKKTDMKLNDVDLLELNEAFAVQSIAVIRLLAEKFEITEEELLTKVNHNGGAIALGHPVGASGCRIIVSLIHEMLRDNAQYGIASLCIGGGMGTAILLKNLNNYLR